MKTLLTAFTFLILGTAPCIAQTFTLSPVTNCPGSAQGAQFTLTAGTHQLQWVSGAWSPTPYDYDCTGFCAYWAGWVFAHIAATGETLHLGAPYSVGWPQGLIDKYYLTYEIAESVAIGTYTFELVTDSVVSFYFLDDFDPLTCEDNRGSVTLALLEPTTTRATTWGFIKALYR